jgi:protein involved in polysaccharide export with SLBB domain
MQRTTVSSGKSPRIHVKPHPSIALLLLAVSLMATACGGYEDKRIRELLNESGFGTRAQGNATVENYVSGGDYVSFILSPQDYQHPAAQQLFLLTQPQRVAIDGTINVPYYGRVDVLGMTEAQLSALVRNLLRPVIAFDVRPQAQIASMGKFIYAFGETGAKGAIPIADLGADLTLFHAIAFAIRWTELANLSRVQVIRPDAEHPLVIEVNIHEMIRTGYMQRNIRLRENDIVYVPPTFHGLVARILERALAPVSVAVNALFGIARVRWAYDIATGRQQSFFFRF